MQKPSSQMKYDKSLPPAIVLGGGSNALSLARSLGRDGGIRVYAINDQHEPVRYSRFCRWIAVPESGGTAQEAWAAYLLGRESDHLRGAVLLTASDEAIQLIIRHRPALAQKFVLDECNPTAQLMMLDKLDTYLAAQAAGVPTPKFWILEAREELEKLKPELVFPVILKPLRGHEFKKKFNRPLVIAHRWDDLATAFDAAQQACIKTFLVEMIPGPDSRLCSYYTYVDEKGNDLFDFSKRIVRRFPVNMGLACYHITDRVPDVKELSLKLLRQTALRGLANIEFKLDQRDGQLKLIECNARFTAADCLLAASGVNLPLFVYRRLLGLPAQPPVAFRTGMTLWDPVQDFRAYRELSGKGLLTFVQWVRSVARPQVLPYFRWYDPLPGLARLVRQVSSFLSDNTGASFSHKRAGIPEPTAIPKVKELGLDE
jgi:D-aspartate ligase